MFVCIYRLSLSLSLFFPSYYFLCFINKMNVMSGCASLFIYSVKTKNSANIYCGTEKKFVDYKALSQWKAIDHTLPKLLFATKKKERVRNQRYQIEWKTKRDKHGRLYGKKLAIFSLAKWKWFSCTEQMCHALAMLSYMNNGKCVTASNLFASMINRTVMYLQWHQKHCKHSIEFNSNIEWVCRVERFDILSEKDEKKIIFNKTLKIDGKSIIFCVISLKVVSHTECIRTNTREKTTYKKHKESIELPVPMCVCVYARVRTDFSCCFIFLA